MQRRLTSFASVRRAWNAEVSLNGHEAELSYWDGPRVLVSYVCGVEMFSMYLNDSCGAALSSTESHLQTCKATVPSSSDLSHVGTVTLLST